MANCVRCGNELSISYGDICIDCVQLAVQVLSHHDYEDKVITAIPKWYDEDEQKRVNDEMNVTPKY